MINRDKLVRSSALAVRVASIANGAFLLAVALGLAASWVMAGRFTTLLLGAGAGGDLAQMTAGARWMLVLGLAMAAGAFVLLRELGAMVASVSAGDPFVAANADRLRRIGWALLFLQLLDIPGYLIRWSFPALGNAAPDAGMSPGGWIAVLMVFVLARIFAAGTALRDDLEGTI
ncbi:DUF2975 domain-containing protein [Azospirillum sp. B4]|uniref:DUF2975 domain-containing protein n=1 Tax=Azospirillum sp. B4 TaxID=95605 RepID=UPI0003484E2E|nr:DUF2975 domain-containing protein [Azospirillum sp. B4]